ncbi:unnamed protein product [Ceutorhynchus assimilis]|uniref:Peptidase A2 domain-containing protein n=1 Tax=Ceutorhynchus assimilis TaxID=467358 RepID=A0A9N9MFE5_9CUCU|nr:unnamed protein product [Ceutorhynchus assimilis]
MCRSKFVKSVEVNSTDIESDELSNEKLCENAERDSSYYNSNIAKIRNISHVSKPSTVNLNIFNDDVCFKIDSGADETVIATKTYRNLKKNKDLNLESIETRLMGPGDAELKVKGIIKVPLIKCNGVKRHVKMFVVRTSENLLGRPVIGKLKMM